MEKATQKEKEETKVEPFLIPDNEKNGAILESIKSCVGVVEKVSKAVDKIIDWINGEEEKLAEKEDHKAFLSLDFNYTDKLKRTAVDTVLRLLGTRLLTEEERIDPDRPLSTGLQATNRPNLFIYYEHKRPEGETHIQEKYTLFVSKDMKLPSVITPEKIKEVKIEEKPPSQKESPSPEILKEKEEVPTRPVEADTADLEEPTEELPPPEILEEKTKEEKEKKKDPGIFETINKVLLGEDEE